MVKAPLSLIFEALNQSTWAATTATASSVCLLLLFSKDLRGRAAPTFKQGNNRFEVSTLIFQKNH